MKNKDIIEKTFLIAWPYGIIFSLVLYLITRDFDLVISFVLGFVSSLFVNSMNYRVMKNVYSQQQDRIKSRQIIMYFVKFVFMGLILYISFDSDAYNVYLTLVGLFTFVIVSVPTAIISSLRGEHTDEL